MKASLAGEKRSEVMQMLLLKPIIAILDEPDSGLDIDAIKAVAEAINILISTGAGLLIITHCKNSKVFVKT